MACPVIIERNKVAHLHILPSLAVVPCFRKKLAGLKDEFLRKQCLQDGCLANSNEGCSAQHKHKCCPCMRRPWLPPVVARTIPGGMVPSLGFPNHLCTGFSTLPFFNHTCDQFSELSHKRVMTIPIRYINHYL